MEIKDFNFYPEILTRTSFYVQSVTQKIKLWAIAPLSFQRALELCGFSLNPIISAQHGQN